MPPQESVLTKVSLTRHLKVNSKQGVGNVPAPFLCQCLQNAYAECLPSSAGKVCQTKALSHIKENLSEQNRYLCDAVHANRRDAA